MGFLKLQDKTVVVLGAANRRSVAYHVGMQLRAEGARVIWVVRSEQRREELSKRLAPDPILVCDVEHENEIEALRLELSELAPTIHGLVHSIAFANYNIQDSANAAPALPAFHDVPKRDFLQAVDISCYSLIRLCGALRENLDPNASVVTISISDTQMAAENYGYMAPIKAALDSTVVFLAKSFSATSRVRFNAVKAGLLKTSASAGIPGYLDSYFYAEACTLRGEALQTQEVADSVLFLLSERSSGINAQGLVVDAGMGVNYFDRKVVNGFTQSQSGATTP